MVAGHLRSVVRRIGRAAVGPPGDVRGPTRSLFCRRSCASAAGMHITGRSRSLAGVASLMGIAATVVLVIGALFVVVAPVLWTVGADGAVHDWFA